MRERGEKRGKIEYRKDEEGEEIGERGNKRGKIEKRKE